MAENMIPETWNKWIVLILALVVGSFTLMIEGKWFAPDVTVWLGRVVNLIAMASTLFGWGVVARPKAGA